MPRDSQLSPDKYLTTEPDIYAAVELLLDSELYLYYSERMVNLMMTDAQEVSLPRF